MKKVFLFCALVFCTYSYAFQTVLTSSIYVSEETASYSSTNITNVSITPRRARFINRITSDPEVQTALSVAESIFSEAMNAEFLEFAPIVAEVAYGEPFEFAFGEVCQVAVLYTDTIIAPTYYKNIGQYYDTYYPTLIPKTMHNLGNGTVSDSPIIQIKLNPNIEYHFDVSRVPNNKCDAITIFLRALAIGCGIHSTLNPETYEFGVTNGGKTYLNAFDSKIYNESGFTCDDVVNGNISIIDFLVNKSISATGYRDVFTHEEIEIKLYNDWENDFNPSNPTMSYKTLNTIDCAMYIEEVDSNFYDLLDAGLGYGHEQRSVSPYTMALLRSLGWEKTIPVGFEDEYHIDDAKLYCSSTTLSPNQTYSVWLSENLDLNDLTCTIESVDSLYVIGVCTDNSFSYSTIPNNVQWKRNPITKNIVGQLECKAGVLTNVEYVEQDKTFAIEIPFRPNRPLVQKSESATNGFITLDLKAFADGSETYTIAYTGLASGDTHTFTVTANALDTILNNITANQLYDMSIYGTNNEGNSETYTFTFGASARPQLNLEVIIMGTSLIYDLSNNGTIDISNVNIELVQITNVLGEVKLISQAESGEPIDISFLTRGSYILTVVADGKAYGKKFVKR